MVPISVEVDTDPRLRSNLTGIRRHLASIGKEAELDRLLELWDPSVENADFTPVAAQFPTFLYTLLDCAEEEQQVFSREINGGGDHFGLLSQAIAGVHHERLPAAYGEFLEDACYDMSSLLEVLVRFTEPSAYLIERNCPEWLFECADYDEVTGSNPISLAEFIGELDDFAFYLNAARFNWRRWLARNTPAHTPS